MTPGSMGMHMLKDSLKKSQNSETALEILEERFQTQLQVKYKIHSN